MRGSFRVFPYLHQRSTLPSSSSRRLSWHRTVLVALASFQAEGAGGFISPGRLQHRHLSSSDGRAGVRIFPATQWQQQNRRRCHFLSQQRRFLSNESGEKDEEKDVVEDLEELEPFPLPEDPREAILARSPDDREVIEKTLDWLQNVVMGLNLCPFAEKPFRTKQLNVGVVSGRDEELISSIVLAECMLRAEEPGTSLIVCPDLYPQRFEIFLQTLNDVR